VPDPASGQTSETVSRQPSPAAPEPDQAEDSDSSDDQNHHEDAMPEPDHDPEPEPQVETVHKRKKYDIKDVFNQDDEETPTKKKRLPLPQGKHGHNKEKITEDKRKNIKSLIDRIPTSKEELFNFPIEYSMVDDLLMEKRIRPWINKKIVEYIGEPEPTLVDFICSKVLLGSDPVSLLSDVQMVLDEEAEVFVVKMWRLLIYEIESKKLGKS